MIHSSRKRKRRAMCWRIVVVVVVLPVVILAADAEPPQQQPTSMMEQMWHRMQEQLSLTSTVQQQPPDNSNAAAMPPKKPHYVHTYNPSKRRQLLHHAAKQMNESFPVLNTTTSTSIPDKANALYDTISSHPQLSSMRSFVRNMFLHAYDSYMRVGFPHELSPISCGQSDFSLVRIPGLTLFDTLDTLLLLDNATEFARATERIRALDGLFHLNVNVSVFETNIRILGGLLSAHQLALAYFETHEAPNVTSIWDVDSGKILDTYDEHLPISPSNTNNTRWNYDGFLLDLALDLGERLLPAFRTSTGIPYGTINLQYGVPVGETPIASLAGAGTLLLEMELLSRYTQDDRFGQAARLAAKALFLRHSKTRGLFGKHIDIQTATWTETLSGIGSNSDSYLEYLAKMYMLFPEDQDFWFMFQYAYSAVYNETRVGEWYADSDMNYANVKRTVLESLAAFYPGLQLALGEYASASKSLNSYFLVREHLGFLPERFQYMIWNVDGGKGAGYHPLRPELLESSYHMSRNFPSWQWASDLAVRHLEQLTKVKCGYASVEYVHQRTTGWVHARTAPLADEMPSFFLSETLKYLYLTFDPDNFLHQDTKRQWIFTTEAHPIHSVPKASDFKQQVATVKNLLKARLGSMHTKKQYQSKDRWAEKTTALTYRSAITALRQSSKSFNHPVGTTVEDFLAPFSNHKVDVFGEVEEKTNAAHMTFASLGSQLPQACPNYHRRELLWTRALTGGVVDYASSYVTSTSDDDYHTKHVLYGAADALGLQGMIKPREELETCPLTLTAHESRVSKNDDGGLDVASELGNFEVSTMTEGRGFHVHHVDSGDQIYTSLVETVENPWEELVLVSTMMHSKAKNGPKDSALRRRLTVADFYGNTFTCTVDIFATSSPQTLLHQMPCSPALFGPSNILTMVERDEFVLESHISFSEEDALGCDETTKGHLVMSRNFAHDVARRDDDTEGTDVCFPDSIRLVRRGECAFFTKALNAKQAWNAQGLVVVNSEDDQHFMMASTKEENDFTFASDLPFSVLVSGRDGDVLFSVLDANEDERLLAKLTMKRKLEKIDHSGKVESPSSIDWPVVRGSGNTLDILSEFGWGIRSVKQTDAEQDWQMQLLRHSFVDT